MSGIFFFRETRTGKFAKQIETVRWTVSFSACVPEDALASTGESLLLRQKRYRSDERCLFFRETRTGKFAKQIETVRWTVSFSACVPEDALASTGESLLLRQKRYRSDERCLFFRETRTGKFAKQIETVRWTVSFSACVPEDALASTGESLLLRQKKIPLV